MLVHYVDAIDQQKHVVVGVVSEILVLESTLEPLTMLSGPRAAIVGPNGMSRKIQSSLTTVFTASQVECVHLINRGQDVLYIDFD